MLDNADPLYGWSLPEVLAQSAGLAFNDVYGKPFCLLRDQLSLFRHNLHASDSCSFKLFNMDARTLTQHLGSAVAFDRIEEM